MIKADIKIHNVIFECVGCGEYRKVEDEQPIAILKLTGIKPDPKAPDTYDMVYNTAFIEKECFDELDLLDEDPEKKQVIQK